MEKQLRSGSIRRRLDFFVETFVVVLLAGLHRKMAEIGKMSRIFASVFYDRFIPNGSLDESIDYLNRAVTLNPTVIASRLELAKSYLAAEEWPSARNFLVSIRELPLQFSDGAKHNQQAERLLEELKDR
jgi:hypothetical protein